jgi:hypothetical protein
MRFPLSFYWTIAAAGAVGVGVWELAKWMF